jgi:hypothetical protein
MASKTATAVSCPDIICIIAAIAVTKVAKALAQGIDGHAVETIVVVAAFN